MIENYKQSVEEFKRVDHLFFVTLKYTRTVDVIRSVLERIISTYEYAINAYLRVLKEEKEIGDIPENPVGKAELACDKCIDKEMCKYMNVYLRLRRLMRAKYTKREEFRRHVTMVTDFEGETLNVDIDLLKEHYDETKKFLSFIKTKVEKYKDD